jgi:hypothetical protein
MAAPVEAPAPVMPAPEAATPQGEPSSPPHAEPTPVPPAESAPPGGVTHPPVM